MKKLREMRIRKRLFSSFLCALVAASLAGIVSVPIIFILNRGYSAALEENGFIQGEIGEYNTYLNRSGAMVRDIIMLTEESEIQESENSLIECDEKVAYYLEIFSHKLETDREKELVAEIEREYEAFLEYREKALTLGKENHKEEAYHVYRNEAMPHLLKIMSDSEELLALNVEMGDDKAHSLEVISLVVIILILVIIFVATLISVKFASYTSQDIEKSVLSVVEATKQMAYGDLNIKLDVTQNNEFGEMAEYFNIAAGRIHTYLETIDWGLDEVGKGNFTVCPDVEFQGEFVSIKEAIERIIVNLNDTMVHIESGAEQVTAGAHQLAQSAQSLADGATNQAGAVQEITATIENVADVAHTSAVNASGAYENASQFAEVVEEGSKEMHRLTEAMENITGTSKEIEVIISKIEDIASQTNLLSLNASIEAARAGDAGRGFAVVADQIGKLAADSAQYAVETRELIVKSMGEISQGNEITLKTASTLEAVMSGIGELAEAASQTSVMLDEQADTMEEIRQAIRQIAAVVQDNSAAAEETSATSEELLAQAEYLRSLVEHFQLLDT